MSHITVVISAATPNQSPPTATRLGDVVGVNEPYVPPTYSVNVTYIPPDTMTPAQIGNEVARAMRHVNQIIGVPAD